MPARPGKGLSGPPMALAQAGRSRPGLASSAAALVLSPEPMPVQHAGAEGHDVFQGRAQLHADDITCCCRPGRWSFMNRSWTTSRRRLVRAGRDHQPVGTRRATSSAWEGPERTTTGQLSPVTSRMISGHAQEVPFSMPLETDTRMAPGASRVRHLPGGRPHAEGRRGHDHQLAQPVTQARSAGVGEAPGGSFTPGSRGFSPVSAQVAGLLRLIGPERHVVAVFHQQHGQGRAPAAAAQTQQSFIFCYLAFALARRLAVEAEFRFCA